MNKSCKSYADHRGYCIGDGEMKCHICGTIYGPYSGDCERIAGGHIASSNISESSDEVQCARCGFWFNPKTGRSNPWGVLEGGNFDG